MPDAVRCGLFTPISTHQLGNGLAHRARFWHEVLSGFGPVTTVVIPLAGTPPAPDPAGPVETIVPLTMDFGSSANLPSRAQLAPETAGRCGSHTATASTSSLSCAYCAPLRSALSPARMRSWLSTSMTTMRTFHDDAGHRREAAKYRALVAEIDLRGRVVSVTGFGTTSAIANSVEPAPSSLGRPDTWAPSHHGRQLRLSPQRRRRPLVHRQVLPRCGRLRFLGSRPGSGSSHPSAWVRPTSALCASADVVVVPLLSGSGSRIKAIEAFAAGVPVVATSVGLSGLDVRPGVDCGSQTIHRTCGSRAAVDRQP